MIARQKCVRGNVGGWNLLRWVGHAGSVQQRPPTEPVSRLRSSARRCEKTGCRLARGTEKNRERANRGPRASLTWNHRRNEDEHAREKGEKETRLLAGTLTRVTRTSRYGSTRGRAGRGQFEREAGATRQTRTSRRASAKDERARV